MSSRRESKTFVKDTTGFIRLPGALETPFEDQDGYITPNDRFFVCSAGCTPCIDIDNWALTISGEALGTLFALPMANCWRWSRSVFLPF